jgi:hypothetical protein
MQNVCASIFASSKLEQTGGHVSYGISGSNLYFIAFFPVGIESFSKSSSQHGELSWNFSFQKIILGLTLDNNQIQDGGGTDLTSSKFKK